jgi:hypothetical protein
MLRGAVETLPEPAPHNVGVIGPDIVILRLLITEVLRIGCECRAM